MLGFFLFAAVRQLEPRVAVRRAGLVVVEPADGSTLEGVFGITAAAAGLSVGLFAVIATIYASVKDLWRFAPNWIRVLFWAVIVIGLIRTVLSWFGQV